MKARAIKMGFMGIAAAFVIANPMTTCAAPETMPDGGVFDAEYYAQQNPDVVAVVGTDTEALYQHYILCGKQEGRQPYANGNENGAKSLLLQRSNLVAPMVANFDDWGNHTNPAVNQYLESLGYTWVPYKGNVTGACGGAGCWTMLPEYGNNQREKFAICVTQYEIFFTFGLEGFGNCTRYEYCTDAVYLEAQKHAELFREVCAYKDQIINDTWWDNKAIRDRYDDFLDDCYAIRYQYSWESENHILNASGTQTSEQIKAERDLYYQQCMAMYGDNWPEEASEAYRNYDNVYDATLWRERRKTTLEEDVRWMDDEVAHFRGLGYEINYHPIGSLYVITAQYGKSSMMLTDFGKKGYSIEIRLPEHTSSKDYIIEHPNGRFYMYDISRDNVALYKETANKIMAAAKGEISYIDLEKYLFANGFKYGWSGF
ncbi:MAG: hypothetical protein K6B69_12565 [Lachnospiraceae bacterium]|nr:hypothetical protein [Lachnospiraceae bacterium]